LGTWVLISENWYKHHLPTCSNKYDQLKIDNTIEYLKRVIESGRVYIQNPAQAPVEMQAFFVGGNQPPFPHGDDL
jgi:hypothetical protein